MLFLCVGNRNGHSDYEVGFLSLYSHRYIFFIEKMIKLLRKFDIQPVFVFDGAKFPAKRHTDEQRLRCARFLFSNLAYVRPSSSKAGNSRVRATKKRQPIFSRKQFRFPSL